MRTVLSWIIIIVIIVLSFYFFKGRDSGETSMKVPAGDSNVDEMVVENAPVDGILEAVDLVLVDYTDEGFSPSELTIKKGQTVRFVNNSSGRMWVASAIHPTHSVYPEKTENDCLGSAFDQCDASLASSFWEFKFNVVGEHGYHNHVKASDRGKVIVTE